MSSACSIFIRLMFIRCRRFWVRLLPKSFGDLERVDIEIPPPCRLIAGLMQLPVMTTAEGHRKFIADLHPQCPRLGKTQVMRIGGLTSADKAGLGRDETQM